MGIPATNSSRSIAPEPATRTMAGHFSGAGWLAGGVGREMVPARLNPLAGTETSSSPSREIFSLRVEMEATSSRATSNSMLGMLMRTSAPSSSVHNSHGMSPPGFLSVSW